MVQFAATDGTPLLMLYGGSDSLDADDPLSIASSGESKINILDIGGKTWYEPQTVDAPTSGPVLPGCGAEQGSIWVYDSNYGVTGMQLSPVRVLDDVHWSWSSPTEQYQLPITRFGAAFAYVPTSTQFYMHGGIPLSSTSNKADDPPGIANNLDILSPSNFSWEYASNGPARKYHTLCYIKSIDSIVLFGGSDQNIASYNDIKLYSVKTSSWSYSLDVSGNVPAQRVLHSAVCTDDSMLIFGGTHSIGDSPSDSTVWVLKANNETSFSWSKAPITSTSLDMSPSARFGHSAALYNNSMYLYGGIGPNGKDDAVYVLDVKSWEWSQISTSDSGSDRSGGSGVNTRVLIAAIVSAVLGVICVGIAAFVFYRWNRRRSTTQGKQNEHTDTKEMPRSNEYSNSGDTAAIMEASNGDFNADGYIKDIGNPVIVPGTPAGESTSNHLSQYLDPTYASTQSNPRDTASALVYEPIMYVTVSRTSTDAPSITQSSLKGESKRSSSHKHRNNCSYTRHQDPELSDADFASAGLQSDTAAQNVLTALSSSIAQPMSPPVPLRMNSLYGELENKGIIVGQAASPQTVVSTGHVVPEEGGITNTHASPRTAHTPHEQTDAYTVFSDLARVSRTDVDDEILSPLDRLARYHAMDAWMVSGANTENTESVSQPSDSEATDDTSNIYNAVDPFDKIDLRVGHVLSVEKHPDADMLYVLSVSLGEPESANNSKDTKPRTIVSGLVKHYSSDQLVGKSVVVFANMKPRKLRGIVSQGMLLAASSLENDVLTVEVLEAPEGARPGDIVTTDATEQQGNSQSTAGALGVCPFTKPLVKKQSVIEVFIQGLELNQRSAKYRGHNLVSENGGFISTKNLHSGSIG
ncbi:hypothetical protein EV177_004160 [Coemansia sp. RSA 1804]|nr:hypothetical protein EV177_004160 [Coemansia sp. RSA 1804]